MHSRRSPVVAPLALALPHPPLLRRRSSLLSNDARLPRTPTCGSPVQVLMPASSANNRKSSDSWGSYDELDEVEHEWKTDHTALLTRTLDALPAHILTPFAGAPPANLLDKVARGIITAKGAGDWPHSIRATRIKLTEIVRARMKEERRKSVIKEENSEGGEQYPDGSPVSNRRPLYRQSSMEFMRNANLGGNEAIGRLSSRLQRAERLNPSSNYHPYSRPDPRTPSKANGPRTLSTLNPRTPSQSTLVSTSKRTSVSSIVSVSSDGYGTAPLLDPRVQRIRRSDSWGSLAMQLDTQHAAPVPQQAQPSTSRPLKRAPSYGASSSNSPADSPKVDADGFVRVRKDSADSTLSDEEEKQRARNAKKARRKSPTPPPPPSSLPCSPALPGDDPFGSKPLKSPRDAGAPTPARKPSAAPRRAPAQRVPSMFGPELPAAPAATSPVSSCPSAFRGAPVPPIAPSAVPVAPGTSSKRARERSSPHPADEPTSPGPQQPRLRRVKATNFANARRISFGSLASAAENCIQPTYAIAGFGGGEAPTDGLALDDAFELH